MIFVGLLASCTKEKPDLKQVVEEPIAFSDIRVVTYNNSGKSEPITMLEFRSIEHYENTIASLEALLEKHDDDFLATCRGLDEDEINTKEVTEGFDEYKPLKDFEQSLSITSSMRQAYEAAVNLWLDNDNLDFEVDPSNVYCFEETEMTLLNSYGEVKIGDFFLVLTSEGFVKIGDANVETLIRFRAGDKSIFEELTVLSNFLIADEGHGNNGDNGNGNESNCTFWKKKNYDDAYTEGKKVKLHVHFHSYPWKGTANAKIKSYKKKSGKWKKHRMMMGVYLVYYFYDANCGDQHIACGTSGTWKYKNKKTLQVTESVWGNFPQYRAKKMYSVVGYFDYNGQITSAVLTW